MYVCIYIYIYIYMICNICKYVYVRMYTCMFVCMYAHNERGYRGINILYIIIHITVLYTIPLLHMCIYIIPL